MLPIADSPRDPNHTPWVTLLLIAVNVLFGLLTLPLAMVAYVPGDPGYTDLVQQVPNAMRDHLTWLSWVVYTFGFQPSEPGLGTTATSMFLHGSGLHLAGNMLYLWIYGPNVERRLGRMPFMLLYLTSGILGTLLFALVSLGTTIPVIGASGAISGLLGAYLIFFPVHTIRVLVLFVAPIRLPAWLVLAIYVLVDNLWPFIAGGDSPVAHTAHLGGFFAGMVLAVGLRFLHREGEGGAESEGRPKADPLARARQLRREGMLFDAHDLLRELAVSTVDEVAQGARDLLAELEADPAFQRAARHR